jgi:hypothetical protein
MTEKSINSVSPAERKEQGPAARLADRQAEGRVKCAFLFLAAFILVSVAIGYGADDGGLKLYRPWLSEKLYLVRHAEPRPNTVFVGASVTLRGIIPAEVDAAAAGAGCSIHSVNLGMPQMELFEAAFMVDRVLNAGLPAKSLIVYDVLSLTRASFENIQNAARAPIAARLRYVSDIVDTTDNIPFVLGYVRAATSETLGIHALSDRLLDRRWSPAQFDWRRVNERGYVALEDELIGDQDVQRRRDDYLAPERQRAHKKALEGWDLAAWHGSSNRPNPFAERIRAAGYIPVAFAQVYPTPMLAAAALEAKSSDPTLAVVSLTKETVPEIYAGNELWFDWSHLTARGAKLASAQAGKALCAIINGI